MAIREKLNFDLRTTIRGFFNSKVFLPVLDEIAKRLNCKVRYFSVSQALSKRPDTIIILFNIEEV